MPVAAQRTLDEVSASLAIGVDIGGTKIAAGVVNGRGEVVRSLRVPTPADNPLAIESEVVRLVRELSPDPIPVGVAAAGFVDAAQAEVRYAPNIQWRQVPLRAQLERALGRPVTVDNDANAAGWAEYRFGAGRTSRHMVMLTIGTGVGGAIITDGVMLRGGFGSAGELGHLQIDPAGERCGCGQDGCLETLASGRALLRRLNALADSEPDGHGLATVRTRDGELTAANVEALVQAGDPGTLRAVTELADTVGAACASLAAVLDPEVFVLGGGVAAIGEPLRLQVARTLDQRLPAGGFRPVARVAIAELGNAAGMIGAADLARSYAPASARTE